MEKKFPLRSGERVSPARAWHEPRTGVRSDIPSPFGERVRVRGLVFTT